jgi:hypothetical protein
MWIDTSVMVVDLPVMVSMRRRGSCSDGADNPIGMLLETPESFP